MKSKTIISIALTAIAIALIGTDYNKERPGRSYLLPQSNTDSMFLICAMNSGRDVNYSHYRQFGANAWHIYCGVSNTGGGWPGVSNDYYNVPFTTYQNELTSKIRLHDSIGFRSVMERPKTVYLCNGQRSIYECETDANVDPDYWFYTYKTHEAGTDVTDNSIHGTGQWVRYCDSGSAPGYVVKGLISNREQARKQPNLSFLSDDSYSWYVMPRIRIDSNTPQNAKVCSIIFYDWNGSKIDSVILMASTFWPDSGIYSGGYLEEFNFTPDANKLMIPPGVICPGAPKNYTDWSSTDSTNTILTDFRVYWYGECDMWIDYVKVENQPAHELSDSIQFNWNAELRGEANTALTGYDSDNPVPNNFYTEEFEFNSLPCIGYVNRIIEDETQGRLTLMANLQYNMFRYHVPPDANGYVEQFTPSRLKKYLVDSAGLNIIVDVGYYLTGWTGNEQGVMIFNPSLPPPKSYHPYTLYSGDYDKSSGILSYKTSVSDYEEKLQNLLDFAHGTDDGLIPVFRRSDSMSKLPGGPAFINLMQAHLWWENGHKLKEPSNEELSLLANLAISYGTKGIMYFGYTSEGSFDSEFYMRGFADTTLQPRTLSVYGQNKWNAAVSLNTKLSNLRPHLMSFDDAGRQSYIYRLPDERSQMSSDTYIKSLKAFPAFEFAPDPVPDLTNHSPDIYSESYLQATVFEKTNEPLDRTKYFFIVNRRCSPFINYNSSDNIGGRRLVTMKINETHLHGFRNWILYDLESNDSLRTISSKDTNDIFLGDFLPGEGKLYKLAPVMQEGGTLIADEDCGGFEFECRGEVINNGHDVTIVPNTTILFANSSARIIMNGGNFKSGIYPEESLTITLKSVGTATWKGLKLTGCDEVEMHQTYFEGISSYPVDSTYAAELTDCGSITVSNSTFSGFVHRQNRLPAVELLISVRPG